MWIIERDSTVATTDEDRGMAHVTYGKETHRHDARLRLINAVKAELLGHVHEIPNYYNLPCITRLAIILDQLYQDDTLDSSDNDGLRFRIREF